MTDTYCEHCGRGKKPTRWFVKGRYKSNKILGWLGYDGGYCSWTGSNFQRQKGKSFNTRKEAAQYLAEFVEHCDLTVYSDFNIVEEEV